MLITSTYFFYIITPRLRPANADLRTGSSIPTRSHPLLAPQVHSKRNHQMSTPWYKHSGTPTSSFFFTTQCTLSGTPHMARPSMYQPVVHPVRTNHFQMMYHPPDTSCLTLLMVSGGNTYWDNIPTLSPPMCHTSRFHYC